MILDHTIVACRRPYLTRQSRLDCLCLFVWPFCIQAHALWAPERGAAYCRLVQDLVDTLNCDGVLAYLDDILLHTWEVEEHLELIQRVLQGHRDSGILLKAAKTRFFQRYVEYLGYGVTEEGVHLTEKAVGLIWSWPVPISGAELASVLGFLGYYRESMAEFAKLSSEMNALKTKKVWVPGDWTSGMQAQFDTLKELLCREGGPVCAHSMVPDGGKAGEFVLMTDCRHIPSPAAWTCLTPLILNFRPEPSLSRGTRWTPPCPRSRERWGNIRLTL